EQLTDPARGRRRLGEGRNHSPRSAYLSHRNLVRQPRQRPRLGEARVEAAKLVDQLALEGLSPTPHLALRDRRELVRGHLPRAFDQAQESVVDARNVRAVVDSLLFSSWTFVVF